MPCRSRSTWYRKEAVTELDMGNPKNKHFIFSLTTLGSDARERRTNKEKTSKASLTGSWEILNIARRKKRVVGQRPGAKKWTTKAQEDHTYKLTKAEHLRYRSNWFLDLIIEQQLHWRITCTEHRKITRSQSHLKIKTEYEKEINVQKPIVKDLESIRKLGGNSGHLRHLPQHGGRVIDGAPITTSYRA